MLSIDDVKYELHKPKDERELEEIVKEHFNDVFGESSLYFDIKPELRSKAGLGSKPDGFVIVLGKPCLYVVEIERAEHGVHDHVVTQISKFNTALRKSPETRRKIADAIYDEIVGDPFKELFVKSKVKVDTYKFLTDLVSEKPIIAIIIDEIIDELRDAVDELPLESRIIEFKTFEREGVGLAVHAHLYSRLERPLVISGVKGAKERPEHAVNWEARLKWVGPEIREMTHKLIKNAENAFPAASHLPRHKWYYFYRGEGRGLDSLFAVLMIGKSYLAVRIKTDPGKLRDEKKWTKKYKGWFFARKYEEREFFVRSEDQFSYALELIRQSYDLSR